MFALKVVGTAATVVALVACSAGAPVDSGTNSEDAFTATKEPELNTSMGRDGVDRRTCGSDASNQCPADYTCILVTGHETGHCFKDCKADTDCPEGQGCRNFDNSGPKDPWSAGHCEVPKARWGAAQAFLKKTYVVATTGSMTTGPVRTMPAGESSLDQP